VELSLIEDKSSRVTPRVELSLIEDKSGAAPYFVCVQIVCEISLANKKPRLFPQGAGLA